MRSAFNRYQFIPLAFIGFANAITIPLMGNVLSIWLTESGYDKDLIGLFALLGLPLSFKLLWTPLVDYVKPPLYCNQQRKGWLLASILGMAIALVGMSLSDPSQEPWVMAASLLLLSLATGCLYIAGIAYELESIEDTSYGRGSAYVVTGFRLGLLWAGAGGLYLSTFFSWNMMYGIMAISLLVGSLTIVFMPEPFKSSEVLNQKRQRFSTYTNIWKGFWCETFWNPCTSFVKKQDWKTIIVFIIAFKVGDELIRAMTSVFYLEQGFSKIDIANVEKIWGMGATIFGAFTMAKYLKGRDLLLSTAQAALLHSCTLFCYLAMAFIGKTYLGLYLTITIEHMTAGMAMTAFIALLWKVCDRGYVATQYAILWSIYLFKGRLLGSFGAFLAMHLAWEYFFLLAGSIAFITTFVVYQGVSKNVDNAVGEQYLKSP